MKNITEETNQNTNINNNMPSVKTFTAAKLNAGFNVIGTKFGQGKKILGLKKDLLSVESQLNSTLAKKIGQTIINQVSNNEEIIVSDEYISEIIELKEKIRNIELELKNV